MVHGPKQVENHWFTVKGKYQLRIVMRAFRRTIQTLSIDRWYRNQSDNWECHFIFFSKATFTRKH